jgi:hypothetical protein
VVLDVTILQMAYTTPPKSRFRTISFSNRSLSGFINVMNVTFFSLDRLVGSLNMPRLYDVPCDRWLVNASESQGAVARDASQSLRQKQIINTITREERIARKMKIDRKPNTFAKALPRTGPIAMLKLQIVN